jgi:hypothetical protein
MTDAEILTLVERLDAACWQKMSFTTVTIWPWQWCTCMPLTSKRQWNECAAA